MTSATEVQQEGLRLGGLRLYREGTPDPDLLQMILDDEILKDGDVVKLIAVISGG